MSQIHHTVLPIYREEIRYLQEGLVREGSKYQITQSLIEIWKFIHQNYPRVFEVQIPGYPDYARELVHPIVSIKPTTDWELVDKFDLEYFRVVEFFANKSTSDERIKIDLSFYDIDDEVYWTNLDPSNVIKRLNSEL